MNSEEKFDFDLFDENEDDDEADPDFGVRVTLGPKGDPPRGGIALRLHEEREVLNLVGCA